MNNPNVLLPYEDFIKISEKANKTNAILSILGTEFPDETCQLIAIKSVLGYVDPEKPELEPEPEDPETDPSEPGEDDATGDEEPEDTEEEPTA